jgi:putative ATP-binding cassette transporter
MLFLPPLRSGLDNLTTPKLLLSLYSLAQGALLVDGQPVPDDYRQQSSAVFSDYHLFDDLVINDASTVGRARSYLDDLELGHKCGSRMDHSRRPICRRV